MKDRKSWKRFIICLMVIAILSVPMIVHADEIAVHKQVETISFFQVMCCVDELLLVILTLTLMYKVKAKNDEKKGRFKKIAKKGNLRIIFYSKKQDTFFSIFFSFYYIIIRLKNLILFIY